MIKWRHSMKFRYQKKKRSSYNSMDSCKAWSLNKDSTYRASKSKNANFHNSESILNMKSSNWLAPIKDCKNKYSKYQACSKPKISNWWKSDLEIEACVRKSPFLLGKPVSISDW